MSDTGIAGDQLRQYVERVERLEEEKSGLAQDIRDVFLEAKGNGFDVKILKRIIAYRKKDRSEVQEEDAIFELYMHALGLN